MDARLIDGDGDGSTLAKVWWHGRAMVSTSKSNICLGEFSASNSGCLKGNMTMVMTWK